MDGMAWDKAREHLMTVEHAVLQSGNEYALKVFVEPLRERLVAGERGEGLYLSIMGLRLDGWSLEV